MALSHIHVIKGLPCLTSALLNAGPPYVTAKLSKVLHYSLSHLQLP